MEMNFLDEFNSIFGTQLKENENKYKMLLQLFHDFIEQSFKTSDLYDSIMSKIVEIEDELQNNLTKEGKEIFKKWELYRDELSNYEAEQSFIYGFCLNKQLKFEKENFKVTKEVLQDDKIKSLINHFDNIFGTDTSKHINYEYMKLLKAIYSYLEERITTPSKRYKEIRHKRVVISEQLRAMLTDDQRTKFDEYSELGNEMQGEELEQVFLFACILLKETDIECKNKVEN